MWKKVAFIGQKSYSITQRYDNMTAVDKAIFERHSSRISFSRTFLSCFVLEKGTFY